MGESQSHFVRILELRGHLSADLFILSHIHSFTLTSRYLVVGGVLEPFYQFSEREKITPHFQSQAESIGLILRASFVIEELQIMQIHPFA